MKPGETISTEIKIKQEDLKFYNQGSWELDKGYTIFVGNSSEDAEKVKAYMHFITALCNMAKNQKRITATAKKVDNEKYAFRCFLLMLGFIGEEYKTARKILLSKLSGSSAFKSGVAMQEEEVVDGN